MRGPTGTEAGRPACGLWPSGRPGPGLLQAALCVLCNSLNFGTMGLKVSGFLREELNELPGAALIDDYRLGGFTQQKSVLSSRGQKSEIRVSSALLLLKALGRGLALLLPTPVAPGSFRGSLASSCIVLFSASSSVSVSSPLTYKRPGIGFRAGFNPVGPCINEFHLQRPNFQIGSYSEVLGAHECWAVIQPTAGGDVERGGTVLGGFLRVFLFLRVSGLAEAGSLGRAEGGPAGAGTAVPGGLLDTGFFSDA